MAKLLSMPEPTQASRPQSEDEFIGGAGIAPRAALDTTGSDAGEATGAAARESTGAKVDLRPISPVGRATKSTDKHRKTAAPAVEEDEKELVSMTVRLPRYMINALTNRAQLDERSVSQVLRRLLKPLDI